ncbi:MAG: hypothetical protein AB1792_04000 [Candidatus Zixiibacteriota bacterium]
MKLPRRLVAGASLFIAALVAAPLFTWAQGQYDARPMKLPWRIAFVRDKNIHLMKGDGSEQKAWRSFGNVQGRLTWSPDGRQLAWSRSGENQYQLPDGGGGARRLYDLFRAEVDSTREGYWRWITWNHGSRSPDWSADGKYIVYTRDMNANQVDAELPDYQIEYSNLDGTEVHRLTRQGAKPGECQGVDPAWSPDGTRIAFVYCKRTQEEPKVVDASQIQSAGGGSPLQLAGLVIAPITGITATEAELEAQAKRAPDVAVPTWSPNGQWIAYVSSVKTDGGIYIMSPDTGAKKKIFAKTDRIVPMQGQVSWSPDSKWLLFATIDGFIYVVDSEGTQRPQRLTSGGNDYYPAFAPR